MQITSCPVKEHHWKEFGTLPVFIHIDELPLSPLCQAVQLLQPQFCVTNKLPEDILCLIIHPDHQLAWYEGPDPVWTPGIDH